MNDRMQKLDQIKFSFNAESDAAYATENLLTMSALYVKEEILWLINVANEFLLVGENKKVSNKKETIIPHQEISEKTKYLH